MTPNHAADFFELRPASKARLPDVSMTPVFSGERFASLVEYPVLVSGWSHAVGPGSSGRVRRAWEAAFTSAERKELGRLHTSLKSWYLREGTPSRVLCDLTTLVLLRRAVHFFAVNV